jgi:hypothetical protein
MSTGSYLENGPGRPPEALRGRIRKASPCLRRNSRPWARVCTLLVRCVRVLTANKNTHLKRIRADGWASWRPSWVPASHSVGRMGRVEHLGPDVVKKFEDECATYAAPPPLFFDLLLSRYCGHALWFLERGPHAS